MLIAAFTVPLLLLQVPPDGVTPPWFRVLTPASSQYSKLEPALKYEPFPYGIVGREVELIRGPLEGVMGRILRTKGAYSLILSVHLIRRSVSVEVDLNDVDFI